MKFSVLGSSSSGNSSFIQLGNKCFLIDAGFSGKKIVEKLENIGKSINQIEGIFVTHEHTDHIKGIGVLSRKYDIPLYIHKKTYSIVKEKIGKINEENLFFFDKGYIHFENSLVTNFEVNHDAEICLGFTFEYNGKKLSYASDIGYADNIVREHFKESDIIALESNYDYNMLMNGSYSWDLKNRVKGRNGHLSNSEAAKLICSVMCKKLKKVFLMHVSKDNNTPELAFEITKEMLLREKREHIHLEVSNDDGTLLFEV